MRQAKLLPLLIVCLSAWAFHGCAGPDIPDTESGAACTSDDDCDPEDYCVNGHCKGSSSGGVTDAGTNTIDAGEHDAGEADAGADAGEQDAGTADGGEQDAGADAGEADSGTADAGSADAGHTDAGATDAGAADGGHTDGGSTDAGLSDAGSSDAGSSDAGSTDAGSHDAGPTPQGQLTLSPGASTVTVTAGAQASPITLTVGNTGTASLSWAITCTGSASPSPTSGTTAIGGSSSVTVALPIWSSAGTQTLTCTATTSDGLGGPLTWTLTATVNAAPTGVGATGGTVDLLDFVFNGDTRPPNCDQNTAYPAAAFASEVVKQAALNTQFALDLGDHMYVCTAGDTGLANAQTQFKNFTDALDANWPSNRLWFMTMGNHECQVNQGNGYCFPGGTDPNFNTWFGGLQKYSKQSFPNYKIDITTRHGLVRLLVIADNSYNATIGTWVDQQLTDADQHAFATLVARHHTVVDRTTPDWVLKLLDNHKATLLMVAHDHKYYRSTYTRANGTTIPAAVCGLGAANTGYTGFCRLTEQANGSFVITQYDIYGTPHDTWSVSGQQ